MEYDFKEYRCTREEIYPQGTLGHDDLTARQGHYIRVDSKEEAIQAMKEKFPKEENFTADLWKVWKDGRVEKV